MKILFICGSLEPGKDGVGDYTRKLAEDLVKKKDCEVHILSINDSFISFDEEYIEEKIFIFRLSHRNTLRDRSKFVKQKINEKFDVGSLQYVPYSFHKKGLPYFLVDVIKNINVKNWHIMFHELWVGLPNSNSLKISIIKYLQKQIIFRTVHLLKPKLISTSISIYKQELPFCNVHILPIFGNIAIQKNKYINHSYSYNLNLVHFGSFSSSLFEFKKQLEWCKCLAVSLKKKAVLWVAGKGGTFSKDALRLSEKILGDGSIKTLGILSEKDISSLFLSCDIGISRANYQFYGKSGSTIAMIEHGLPVVLRGERDILDNENQNQLFYCNDKLPESIPSFQIKSKVEEVGNQFYYSLKEKIK